MNLIHIKLDHFEKMVSETLVFMYLVTLNDHEVIQSGVKLKSSVDSYHNRLERNQFQTFGWKPT